MLNFFLKKINKIACAKIKLKETKWSMWAKTWHVFMIKNMSNKCFNSITTKFFFWSRCPINVKSILHTKKGHFIWNGKFQIDLHNITTINLNGNSILHEYFFCFVLTMLWSQPQNYAISIQCITHRLYTLCIQFVCP